MERSMMYYDERLKKAIDDNNMVEAKKVAVEYFTAHPCLNVIGLTRSNKCYEIRRLETGEIVFLAET